MISGDKIDGVGSLERRAMDVWVDFSPHASTWLTQTETKNGKETDKTGDPEGRQTIEQIQRLSKTQVAAAASR